MFSFLFLLEFFFIFFVFHLRLGFSPDPCIAVHNAGTGDLVVSKFHADGIHRRIQLLALFLFRSVLKQGHLFESVLSKSGECHSDQT